MTLNKLIKNLQNSTEVWIQKNNMY